MQFTLPPGREEEADRFYVGLLGFEAEEKPPVPGRRAAVAGTARVRCASTWGPTPTSARPSGPTRPSWSTTSTRWWPGWPRPGAGVEWDELIPGVARCYVPDPFGNRLELVAAA